jgi:PilZ domain
MGTLSVRNPTQFVSRNSSHTGSEPIRARPCEDTANCAFIERRRQVRCPFTAAATILEPASGARIEAHTTDFCLGGCYVDTMSTLSVGTRVELRLTKDGHSFHSMAKVVSSQSGVGMGLLFSSVEQDQFSLLEMWFSELRGERGHEPHTLEKDERAHCGLAEKDELRYALEALLVQLMRKEVLSEEEGEPILRRLLH